MEQLRFQYKKSWESGNFHMGLHKTFRNELFTLSLPWQFKTDYKAKARLSQPWFYKFKYNIQATLKPTCSCGTVEITIHYLLHCPNFSNERLTLFKKLQSIDENILSKDEFNISKVLLFGDDSFNDVKNTSVLTASVKYILSTKCFDVPFYQNWLLSIFLYAVYF